jgi:hypothetical protein
MHGNIRGHLNVIAHAQKPEFFFPGNGRVHFNSQGPRFSRLLATGVFASAVVMLVISYSEVVLMLLVTYFICQIPLPVSLPSSTLSHRISPGLYGKHSSFGIRDLYLIQIKL